MMRLLMRGAAAATLIAGLALPSLAGAQPGYYGDPQSRYGTNPGQYNDPRTYHDDQTDQGDGYYDQGQSDERPDANDDARGYDDQDDQASDGDRDYGRQDDDRYDGGRDERGYAQSYGSGSQTWRDAWGRTCRWRDQTGRDEEGYVTHRWVQYCR